MRSELAACPALHSSDDTVVDKILGVWSQLQRRTYFYHETAVHAYFQYIALHDGNGSGDQLITATLRLLQLTVKHALELQESLQAGLETTPSGKWKVGAYGCFLRVLLWLQGPHLGPSYIFVSMLIQDDPEDLGPGLG